MTGTDDLNAAHRAFTEHRHFPYRGCAPDSDDPTLAAGCAPDPDDPQGGGMRLSLDAWHGADRDGAEPQKDRVAREQAAIEVCLDCPVMVACDVYANSVTPEGRLAEPDGIRGGRTALERHRAFIAKRHEVAAVASDGRLRTEQKQAVLRALAVCTDPYEVAAAAGVDVRTANWQRSAMVTLLGLPRDASRGQLLAVAVERGLLEGVAVVADDGSVLAVPPPTRMPDAPSAASVALFAADRAAAAGPVPAAERSVSQRPAGPSQDSPGSGEGATPGPVRVRSPRRDRFTDIAGQLSLDDLAPAGATVSVLPIHSVPLEAAA